MNQEAEDQKTQNADTILIRGQEVPVVTTQLPQDSLKFFVDNPRIYSVLHKHGNEKPSQEKIQEELLKMEHVRELIQDIKHDGGLTDPIIVRKGKLEVLEGNSRLAAYRRLAKFNPIKWGIIKVRLLPEDMDEKLILALLGQYHLKGKTAWSPFEKAGFLYRRHVSHNVPVDQLAREVGETKRKVASMVEVYQFMVDNGQEDKARWSYYDEYLKSRNINKVRSEVFDKLIVEKIDSKEIPRAVDIREKLNVICKAPKQLKKFKAGEYDFQEAYEWAVEAGHDNTPYSKLSRFRKWLATQDTEDTLVRTGGEARKKIVYELDKLAPIVSRILKNLKK